MVKLKEIWEMFGSYTIAQYIFFVIVGGLVTIIGAAIGDKISDGSRKRKNCMILFITLLIIMSVGMFIFGLATLNINAIIIGAMIYCFAQGMHEEI